MTSKWYFWSVKSVSYMQDSVAKEKKWGKKMSGNFAIKGGGGRTPNGKCHLKFPFWFLTTSLNVNGKNLLSSIWRVPFNLSCFLFLFWFPGVKIRHQENVWRSWGMVIGVLASSISHPLSSHSCRLPHYLFLDIFLLTLVFYFSFFSHPLFSHFCCLPYFFSSICLPLQFFN